MVTRHQNCDDHTDNCIIKMVTNLKFQKLLAILTSPKLSPKTTVHLFTRISKNIINLSVASSYGPCAHLRQLVFFWTCHSRFCDQLFPHFSSNFLNVFSKSSFSFHKCISSKMIDFSKYIPKPIRFLKFHQFFLKY